MKFSSSMCCSILNSGQSQQHLNTPSLFPIIVAFISKSWPAVRPTSFYNSDDFLFLFHQLLQSYLVLLLQYRLVDIDVAVQINPI